MAERSNEHEMKPVRCGCGGEAEVDGKRYTVNAEELISAVKRAMVGVML